MIFGNQPLAKMPRGRNVGILDYIILDVKVPQFYQIIKGAIGDGGQVGVFDKDRVKFWDACKDLSCQRAQIRAVGDQYFVEVFEIGESIVLKLLQRLSKKLDSLYFIIIEGTLCKVFREVIYGIRSAGKSMPTDLTWT